MGASAFAGFTVTLPGASIAASLATLIVAAVRDADNGEQFLRSASSIIGVEAEILAGDEEGHLSYLGATADLPGRALDPVVLDIGGGSTEIVMATDGEMSVVSMNLGCVRLTERCLLHDPPTATEEAAAVQVIADELRQVEGALGVALTGWKAKLVEAKAGS